MKRRYVLLNTYRYRVTYTIVFIVNFIIVTSLYYMGWLGEVTNNYSYLVLLVLVGTVLNPLDYRDSFALLEKLFVLDSNHYDGDTLIELRMFRIIYLSILWLLTISIPNVYYHGCRGDAILLAFILLFYIPTGWNYIYVEVMKKRENI